MNSSPRRNGVPNHIHTALDICLSPGNRIRRTVILFLLLAIGWLAEAGVVSFEEISTAPRGFAPVEYQYSPILGIIFKNAVCADAGVYGGAGLPRSGTKYIQPCFGIEFCSNPLQMDFRSDQKRIKIWVGYEGSLQSRQTVILKAYSGTGASLGQATASLGPSTAVIPIRTPLEVSAAGIRRALVYFSGSEGTQPSMLNNNLAVDDVEFEGDAPPPCADSPVVSLHSPSDGLQTDGSQITVEGTITGSNLPAECAVTVAARQLPPHDFTPPFSYSATLSGSGNNRSFSIPVNLKLGDQTVTVSIRNDCGYLGQAIAVVNNLPTAIRQRYEQEGGEPKAGKLQWIVRSACPIAVYEKMAIAQIQQEFGPITLVIRSPFLGKWKEWVSKPYHDVTPDFCPRSETIKYGTSAEFQDFGSGRMYYGVHPSGAGFGPLFVPKVFVDAIEALGGVGATGLPVTDPLESPSARTWLFQQFVRSKYPNNPYGKLLCTLEIKGDPPMLHIERQGGDLKLLGNANLPLNDWTPTISESFPCSSRYGPCNLATPPRQPRISADAAKVLCHNTTFTLNPASVREWEPVIGDCDTTTAIGYLTESYLAGHDLTTSHNHKYYLPGRITSDWCYKILPLPEFAYTLANNNKLEIEIEAGDLGYFSYDSIQLRLPLGVLFQASGRWIIDCGHSPYNSEIHPPGLLAYMRTGAMPWSGADATLATISVNGYWNRLPASVTICPPPRPAPNAFLSLFKPADAEAGWGLSVKWEMDSDWSQFVRVEFSSAIPASCIVNTSYSGQVWPMATQEYYGTWYVGWRVDPSYSVTSFDY